MRYLVAWVKSFRSFSIWRRINLAINKCSQEMRFSKIKLEENGRKAIFLNQAKERFVKIQVDGCLIINETACDWWIKNAKEEGVLVELKGTDVDHAIDQIEKTFAYLKKTGMATAKLAALIVCRRYPRHHP